MSTPNTAERVSTEATRDGGPPLLVDAVVIGTGQAAGVVVSALRGRDQRVAVFERGLVGGTCLNRGCRPTKAMRACARIAHTARRARQWGVDVQGVEVDMKAVVARKDEMIDDWRAGQADWLAGDEGIVFLRTGGRLAAATADVPAGHHLVLGEDGSRVAAPRVYLNTGLRPVVPPIDGLAEAGYLDNDSVLHVEEVPAELVVLGGSYIGLEFGQMFARFGSRVTVVESSGRLADREEPEVSAAVERLFADEGIDVRTGTRAAGVSREGGRVTVSFEDGGSVSGTHVLVALGRRPNTDDLGLDEVGVRTDDKGFVEVDEHFETSVPGVYALGDINGHGPFTHTSVKDGEIAADNAAGGGMSVAGRIPTYAIFTDPPIGRVGMSEAEVRDAGIDAMVARYDMADVSRAVLDGETVGVMKILVEAGDRGRILGATVMGPAGDEITQVVSALMHAGASWRVLAGMLPIHPTVGEFWPTVLGDLHPLT